MTRVALRARARGLAERHGADGIGHGDALGAQATEDALAELVLDGVLVDEARHVTAEREIERVGAEARTEVRQRRGLGEQAGPLPGRPRGLLGQERPPPTRNAVLADPDRPPGRQ